MLTDAQGAVREGAQAIDNLSHLLGSRRVGPRAIGRAIGEMREGCVALLAALADLGRALTECFHGDTEASDLARSLLAKAGACVERLAAELAGLKRDEVDARERLALEAAARRAGSELEAVLFLVDLLTGAASQKTNLIELGDVLHGSASSQAKGGATVRATSSIPGRQPFAGDARFAEGLLRLAVGIVVAAGVTSPHIAAEALAGPRVRVRLSGAEAPAGTGGGAEARAFSLKLPFGDRLPEATAVARTAARLARIEVEIAPGAREITLVLGEPSGSSPAE